MTDTSVPLLDMARDAVRNMSDDEKVDFAIEICLGITAPTAGPALTYASERIVQHGRMLAIVDRHESGLLDAPEQCRKYATRTKPSGECQWINGQPHWVLPKFREDDLAVIRAVYARANRKVPATIAAVLPEENCQVIRAETSLASEIGFRDLRAAKTHAKHVQSLGRGQAKMLPQLIHKHIYAKANSWLSFSRERIKLMIHQAKKKCGFFVEPRIGRDDV